MTTVRVHVDTSEIDRELDRLQRGMTAAHLMRMSSILSTQFAHTQAEVHVITGSLRASGKVDTPRREDGWEGVISYGGPSASGSVHNPVTYAREEQSRDGMPWPGSNLAGRVSNDHDFMQWALDPEYDRAYIATVMAYLQGDL